jgi:hypothetical protein
MSDISQGPGWWQAADLKWYPPELHADYVPPPPPPLPPPARGQQVAQPNRAPWPRGDAAPMGGQPAGAHSAGPGVGASPWDKARQFMSGLSDAQPHTPLGQGPSGQHPAAGGSRATLDLGLIMPGGLIAAVGSLLYVVVSFFPWYTVDLCSADVCGNELALTKSAWDRGSASFSVLLFLLAGALFVAAALQVVPRKVPLVMIALGVVGLGDIFFVAELVGHVPSFVSRGFGLWAAFVLCIAITAGTVLQSIKDRARPGV